MSRTTHPELAETRYSILPRHFAYSRPVKAMSLLIVEDNSQMRSLIKSVVQEYADEVFECADGSEVFAAYREHRPDWVFMDIEMEQMDGIAASRLLLESLRIQGLFSRSSIRKNPASHDLGFPSWTYGCLYYKTLNHSKQYG